MVRSPKPQCTGSESGSELDDRVHVAIPQEVLVDAQILGELHELDTRVPVAGVLGRPLEPVLS